MDWDKIDKYEKMAKKQALQIICNDLIEHHPDYKYFKKSNVFVGSLGDEIDGRKVQDGTCVIKWNGHKLDEVTGWGLLMIEFPESEIFAVMKRYSDKIEYHKNNEEEE